MEQEVDDRWHGHRSGVAEDRGQLGWKGEGGWRGQRPRSMMGGMVARSSETETDVDNGRRAVQSLDLAQVQK